MSIKSIVGLVTAAGLVVSMGAACGGVVTPTPVPTAVPTNTPVTPPATLLSLSNTGAVAVAAPVFGGGPINVFIVPTAGKLVTIKYTASAPVSLTYFITNPGYIPSTTVTNTQSITNSFTPATAGSYGLFTIAAAAIGAGTTVSVVVTQ